MKISTIIANLSAGEHNIEYEFNGIDVPTITSKDLTFHSYVCSDNDYLNIHNGWYPYHIFYDDIKNIQKARIIQHHYSGNKELTSSSIELTKDGLVLELDFNVVKASNIKLYYSIFYSLIKTFMREHKLIKVILKIHKIC